MAINALGSVDVPLSLFSSLDTELSPSDIPEGISPDNQDVVFTPGTVSTRPALQKIFTSALDAGQVVYEKSFQTPNGNIKNLYLTSAGNMYVEDLTVSPGTATLLFTTLATRAESVTAFGREYIALSNGVHGYDIPLQYDGTNVYRVTQDGPGTPPTVSSTIIPSGPLFVSSGVTGSIVSITSTDSHLLPFHGGVVWLSFTVTLSAPVTYNPAVSVVISGNTGFFNGTWTIETIISPTQFKVSYYQTSSDTGTGGTAVQPGVSIIRASNTVTAYSTAAANFQVGYQAQISGITATQVGGGIASIVIDNEDNPGIATVTTNTAHGLLPLNNVTINNVPNTVVGTSIVNIVTISDISTVTTSTPHGLSVGSEVLVQSTGGPFVIFTVQTVPSPTTFTYAEVKANATLTGGTVEYYWPLASSDPAANFFQVVEAPTATTFTVAISYPDGTWSGGDVSFSWDGTFYVTAVDPNGTWIQYQQYGPNASSTDIGTLTPVGQITPGVHQLQVLFLTATNAITEPSPPVTFTANGGQYLTVSNIPLGPPNVIARILALTGAGGAYFFYLPVPAQVNGQVVSTATQLNDNTTRTTILDISDNTLYTGIGISVPGNNLVEQVVLGPCAGFFTYSSRLVAWGDYNKVENLLNMGFDGGYLDPSLPIAPTGWTLVTTGGGLINTRFSGMGWQINTGTGTGQLSQSFWQDAYSDSIALPNTAYSIRVYLVGAGTFVATLTSATTAFASTATITFTGTGWYTANFSASTPTTIPADLLLSIKGTSGTFTVDEISIYYTAQSFNDTEAKFSYEDNPEGVDGLTGIAGPEDDNTAIRNWGVIRDTLNCVTGGSLHETIDNGTTEPSEWGFRHVADNCGAWSISSIARNVQGIGSSGKEWMAWGGPDGAQIFTGQQPMKISQEIESIWENTDESLAALAWAANDQISKRCFFGLPVGSSMQLLVLDYRNLDGEGIASSPPVHISFTGKMIASDLTRKWTRWSVPLQSGALMYRPGDALGAPQIVFGGTNAYTLNSAKYTDDDYGQIFSYYTTYFFVSHEMEQALQVGSHRKLYTYITAYIEGSGMFNITPLGATLSNLFPSTLNLALNADQPFDLESGLNVETSRCAFKIQVLPLLGQTDAYFSLQKLVVNMMPSPWAKVRGSVSGSF